MPEFIIGARGHDFGRHTPEQLLTSIGKAGFRCTQLAYTKAIEGVKSYADITPELVGATKAAVAASGVSIAVDGTYVELSYADEDKRRAEVARSVGAFKFQTEVVRRIIVQLHVTIKAVAPVASGLARVQRHIVDQRKAVQAAVRILYITLAVKAVTAQGDVLADDARTQPCLAS